PPAEPSWPILVTDAWAGARLPKLTPTMHKGDRGRVTVVGGSSGMTGAALHAARAALAAGAGLVKLVAGPETIQAARASLPDVLTLESALGPELEPAAAEALEWADALVVGPGLGRAPARAPFLQAVLARRPLPTVVDADALALFVGPVERPVVLTPHLGEFRAQFGDELADAAANDRWGAAAKAAQKVKGTGLLKGVPTVIAVLSDGPTVRQSARWRPEDRVLISDFSVIEAVAASPFTVFAATTHGLTICDRQARTWRLPVTALDGYPPARVYAALADVVDNAVWLGTTDGWARYDANVRTWEQGRVPGGVASLMLDARDPASGIFVQGAFGWGFLPRGALVPVPDRPLPPPGQRMVPLDARTALAQTPLADAMRALILTDPRLSHYRFTAAARSPDLSELFLGSDGVGLIRLRPSPGRRMASGSATRAASSSSRTTVRWSGWVGRTRPSSVWSPGGRASGSARRVASACSRRGRTTSRYHPTLQHNRRWAGRF